MANLNSDQKIDTILLVLKVATPVVITGMLVIIGLLVVIMKADHRLEIFKNPITKFFTKVIKKH